MNMIRVSGMLLALCVATNIFAEDRKKTPAPKDAKVYIISPKNGEKVKSPVTVRFGLSGMGVAPAGIDIPNTGHHHLIIDSELPAMNISVPKDEKHIHYGNGQTEAVIELKPGKHTLQLLLGDHAHFPHDPPIKSEKVTIVVK